MTATETIRDQPRLKIFWVRKVDVIALFAGQICFADQLLPGTVVDDVHYSFERNCFGFCIWHESFSIVLPGEKVPVFSPILKVVPQPDTIIVSDDV